MIDISALERIRAALAVSPTAAHEAIVAEIPVRQEAEPTAEKTDMDTLGSLVDKLVTVDLKMWHNQEVLYSIRRMDADGFRQTWGDRFEALHEVLKRCCDLNVQRASLMDEIDQFLVRAVSGELSKEDLVRLQHKTY